MTREFSGRLAFITGGLSGIGAQVCQDLANAGASVIVAGRLLEPAQALAASLPTVDGSEHFGVQVDVSVKAQVENAVEQVKIKCGRPAELIVNCAGVGGSVAPLEEMEEDDFDKVISVNFKGTFLVTQAFGRALLDAGKPGSIVNVSSVLAYAVWENCAPYSSAKAAVQQFTRVAAKEWGPRGIRVNNITPGLIRTKMTGHLQGGPAWKSYEETSSLRRIGDPKDVTGGILYLLSDRSGFVTGANLEVSG